MRRARRGSDQQRNSGVTDTEIESERERGKIGSSPITGEKWKS